jgi:hypothetical protein
MSSRSGVLGEWALVSHGKIATVSNAAMLAALVAQRFDPSQPRADDGRWTSTGGGGDIPTKPSPEYQKEIRAWAAKQIGGSAIGKPDALFILGSEYRATDETDAMAEYIEKHSSREAMVRAMSSQTEWGTGYAFATGEWQGAWACGANKKCSKATQEEIDFSNKKQPFAEDDAKAFRARTEFLQARVREVYADKIHDDKITLYRGVHGKQAQEIVRRGIQQDEEVDVEQYGLSSWTTSQYDAQHFARGMKRKERYSAVLKTDVDIKDVYGGNDVGARGVIRFSDDHGEIVVMNRGTKRRAVRVG